jgi:3'(2'), 5'-bisphosphate nucleotidase
MIIWNSSAITSDPQSDSFTIHMIIRSLLRSHLPRQTRSSPSHLLFRPMSSSLPFTRLRAETELAVHAVLRACALTKSVQNTLVVDDTITKPDKSPVTAADLSAQSLISLYLRKAYPTDPIIGEEDTTELRANTPLRERVVRLVNQYGEEAYTEEQVLEAIDAGSAEGGSQGRFWTIDPVDGTSGFIRKQQYAVCLALIVDGKVEMGVIGCPNISPTHAKLGEEIMPNGAGVVMVTVRGQGSYSVRLLSPSYVVELPV